MLNSLRPGLRLAAGLFSTGGVRLLPANAVLSENVYLALLASGENTFFWASDLLDLAAMLPLDRPAAPKAGTVATANMLTVGGLLALGQGQIVEEHHSDAYALGAFAPEIGGMRGPDGRVVPHNQWTRLSRTMMDVAEQLALAASPTWAAISRTLPKSGGGLQVAASLRTDWPQPTELAVMRQQRVQHIRRHLAALVAGVPFSLDGPDGPLAIVDELIDLCATHPFRFAELATCPSGDAEYLPNHLWAACAISVGMAVRLKWPRTWCRRAGLAGMLADVGMAMVPAGLRFSTETLEPANVQIVRKHVAHSVVMLGAIIGLEDEVRLAVFQHHEREDETGYPNAAAARVIHPLAKLLAVSDSYAAATAARPHRADQAPALPYDVMQQLIGMTSDGKLERKYLRALVDLFGLFPVGSTVTLSDGSFARVVGVDSIMVDRPIVRRIGGQSGEPGGEPIVLAKIEAAELFVLEAIAEPLHPSANTDESRRLHNASRCRTL